MSFFEFFETLDPNKPFVRSIANKEHLRWTLFFESDLQEVAFKLFISKLSLLNPIVSQQEWNVFTYCTTFFEDVKTYDQRSLFYLQIGKMVTIISNVDEAKGIVSEPSDESLWSSDKEIIRLLFRD